MLEEEANPATVLQCACYLSGNLVQSSLTAIGVMRNDACGSNDCLQVLFITQASGVVTLIFIQITILRVECAVVRKFRFTFSLWSEVFSPFRWLQIV